jgi:hypothetical protein
VTIWKNYINIFFNKSEFFIVSVGSAINFVIKCSLVTFNYNFNILPFELFYLLTHMFISLFSWVFHSQISFKFKKDKNNFNRFIGYNILLKFGDYLFVVFLTFISLAHPIIFLAISSVLFFVIRYIILRMLVFK